MSKECKHEEWNPCGNDFYSCRKCGILRTSQQVNLYEEKDKQIADLEAKLAEKEEILNWQNEIIEGVKQEEELLAQKLKSLGVDCIEDLGKTYDQDKISFAVEKLVDVQKYISDNAVFVEEECFAREINDFIDNQIKQLKEMK